MKPDYNTYSLDELEEAYESINKDLYPERFAELEKILLNHVEYGIFDESQIESHEHIVEKRMLPRFFYFLFFIAMFHLVLTAKRYLFFQSDRDKGFIGSFFDPDPGVAIISGIVALLTFIAVMVHKE